MTKPTDDAPALSLPPQYLDRLPRRLLERCLELADMQVAFYEGTIAAGAIDRARFRECFDAYARLRHDILTCLGEDPQSGDLLPLPVALHDS